MSAAKTNRKIHRLGAVLSAIPVLIILVTGLILQLKKQSSWVQPPTRTGVSSAPTLSFDRVLAVARGVETAGIRAWSDIDRLDVRPAKGVVKVRGKNRWEIQIDTATGDVLQVAYRRSDLIENLHDGSFFHDKAKLWVFLPAAGLLLMLWGTGVYLWLLPHLVKRRRLGLRRKSA